MADDTPKLGSLKKTQVKEQLDIANQSIGALSALLDMLGEKLDPVLRLEQPDKGNEPICAQERIVPLADDLRANSRRISDECERVRSWLGRLEL